MSWRQLSAMQSFALAASALNESKQTNQDFPLIFFAAFLALAIGTMLCEDR